MSYSDKFLNHFDYEELKTNKFRTLSEVNSYSVKLRLLATVTPTQFGQRSLILTPLFQSPYLPQG